MSNPLYNYPYSPNHLAPPSRPSSSAQHARMSSPTGSDFSNGNRFSVMSAASEPMENGSSTFSTQPLVERNSSNLTVGASSLTPSPRASSSLNRYMPPSNNLDFPHDSALSVDYKADCADPDFDIALFLDRRNAWRFNARGICNTVVIIALMLAIVGLFAGYPIAVYVQEDIAYNNAMKEKENGYQSTTPPTVVVPLTPQLKLPIDPTTPQDKLLKTASDGSQWKLVFSDEFNEDGRSFYPDADPYWEAVDLHYWLTGDLQWYAPDAVTTANGEMVITLKQEALHNLNYSSAMIQSWNKFCFTGGILEVNVSLPGNSQVPGFWPGVWTMGNLARPGYGATTEGVWPYSYDSCDQGVTKNMSLVMASYLPGQRLNKCICSATVEHPSPGIGRGAPEIDVLEAAADDQQFPNTKVGTASQSAQFAPFDFNLLANTSGISITNANGTSFSDTDYANGLTIANSYTGGLLQQAVSGLTQLDPSVYEGRKYQTYAFEYVPSGTPGTVGYIRWSIDDIETWRMYESAVGPNAQSKVSQRLISKEPMSIVLNLGISPGFGPVDIANLTFPATFHIDYVRVYQHPDRQSISCDPPDMPTATYIKNHYNAYMNPNLTTWAQAGYMFPSYNLNTQC